MKYEIWVEGLSSLYTDHPSVPVKAEEVSNYIQARERRDFYQTHDTAAWIQD